jgi:hypothetical protein
MSTTPTSSAKLIAALGIIAKVLESHARLGAAVVNQAVERIQQLDRELNAAAAQMKRLDAEIGLLKARLSSDAAIEKWKRDKAGGAAPLPAPCPPLPA